MNEKSDGMIKAALKRRRLATLLAASAMAISAAAPAMVWAQSIAAPPPPPPPTSNPPLSSNAPPGSNPVCVRLESQLTSLDQGAADPARADQIKRSEDAIAKQQADLDRAVAQAHKAGCAGEGFFAFFSALSPQCGPITSQIQQMRGNLDRMISDVEQLKTGDTGQQAQRRALIGQLAQNSCGAQYTAAANSVSGPQSFFDALFGGGTIVNPSGDGAPSGTYHTVCVRACDGYYFPISYSTVPSRFADDERACQRQCPASQAELYSFRNPGEDMNQAVSIGGQTYTALPNAFRYRKEVVNGCSCRAAGQSWADALKNADDATTLESGDIVVNDRNAKMLSQPPKQPGKPAAISTAVKPAALTSTPSPAAADGAGPAKPVRVVGPPFLSRSALQAESASQSESQPAPVSH
ncbi:MAG: DUF2865 domain-containing protein [Xanthobacteraceae bacterium]